MADLSNMKLAELRDLQAQVGDELKKRHLLNRANAREQILAIAQQLGMPLKDLMAATKGEKKEKAVVAVRFQDKTDPAKKWTGRGRQPQWIKDWVTSGKSLDELRV